METANGWSGLYLLRPASTRAALVAFPRISVDRHAQIFVGHHVAVRSTSTSLAPAGRRRAWLGTTYHYAPGSQQVAAIAVLCTPRGGDVGERTRQTSTLQLLHARCWPAGDASVLLSALSADDLSSVLIKTPHVGHRTDEKKRKRKSDHHTSKLANLVKLKTLTGVLDVQLVTD